MKIGFAIQTLQDNEYVRRESWPTRQYLYLNGEVIMMQLNGIDYVWTPTHLDLLAADWIDTLPVR